MKHAQDVIGLLSCNPCIERRMGDFVKVINPHPTLKERGSIRIAVSRVLFMLVDSGQVAMTPPKTQGSYALYRWNVRE